MWLMSLFTTWTNISQIAAVKVQLYLLSALCFLTQHSVSTTPNKLQYKTRGCWPNETQARSTLTDKTEPESTAAHSTTLALFLCWNKERLWMTGRKKRDLLGVHFHFSLPSLNDFFRGRFIQDVTAACVLVGALRRVTALWPCVRAHVFVCVCVCVSEQFLRQ